MVEDVMDENRIRPNNLYWIFEKKYGNYREFYVFKQKLDNYKNFTFFLTHHAADRAQTVEQRSQRHNLIGANEMISETDQNGDRQIKMDVRSCMFELRVSKRLDDRNWSARKM